LLRELQQALAEVKTLQSHGICPDCAAKVWR